MEIRDAIIDATVDACAKHAVKVARAISKGTHGKVDSVEEVGEVIAREIRSEFK